MFVNTRAGGRQVTGPEVRSTPSPAGPVPFGGMASNRCTGRHTAGAMAGLVAGKPVTRVSGPKARNDGNVVGARVAPSLRQLRVRDR